MSTVELEVGKSYISEKNNVVTITGNIGDIVSISDKIYTASNGRRYYGDGSEYRPFMLKTSDASLREDLISEYVQPSNKETDMSDNRTPSDPAEKLSLKTRTSYLDKAGNTVNIEQCEITEVSGAHLVLYRGHIGDIGDAYYTEHGHIVTGYNYDGKINFEDLVSEVKPS